jgi:ubiquinone/menaquinone biosynthesis C-methylase UbiE
MARPLFFLSMHLLTAFLRPFFYLLYHPLAWSYDLISATVSLGRWQCWVRTVMPYLKGPRLLELGPGPGHLQLSLRALGNAPQATQPRLVFGMDASRQMSHLASKRLHRNGHTQLNLTRGLAQALPFLDGSFQSVVSTFPSEYIFDPITLTESWRILAPGGRLVVLPAAWITGQHLTERWAAGLFCLTGQAPQGAFETIQNRLKEPFEQAGFHVTIEHLEVNSSVVMIILASKPTHPGNPN